MFYVRKRRNPKSLLGLGASDTFLWALWHYVCVGSRWRERWNNPFIFKLIIMRTVDIMRNGLLSVRLRLRVFRIEDGIDRWDVIVRCRHTRAHH